jgi:sugar phosphate isomerase/epimerase
MVPIPMTHNDKVSRRSFLALASAAPFMPAVTKGKPVPVGLELYSVRDQLKQDLPGTLRSVAKMGYAGVEFFAPYFEWTPDYAKEVRKLLDDLGLRCFSTHNSSLAFAPDRLNHAIELNRILGSKFIVMASVERFQGFDGWKAVAENLNRAAQIMKPLGLRAGFHNHQVEFTPVEGRRPIDVLAANTSKDVALQLDVGNCLRAGGDPVAWIRANPGRIASMHVKDWSPDPAKDYAVLLGEGIALWKKIFEAAEKGGGIQYYLIEQEGSAYPPMETAERCLAAFRRLRAS